jgi:hypothetical protein
MEQQQKALTEEDYLRKHLEKIEKKPSVYDTQAPIKQQQKDNSRTTDLQYQAFDCSLFPCGIFYLNGTTIQVRPALVKEIQAYSMVDDNNFPDIIDKMNDMLMACVRVKYSNGDIGSYLDIKEQDRIYLLFLIRDLTFQQGMYLTVNKECKCKNEVQVELKPAHFIYFKLNETMEKYFDNYNKCFTFDYKGQEFNLTMPNIGLQKSFTDYITEEVGQKKDPNLSFLKIMPFLLGDRNYIDSKEIKEQLKTFQSLSVDAFQFLNSAISHMKFGIEKLRKNCSVCGKEVHTEMVFPNGASGIFVIHDAFERFIQE